MKRRLAGLLTAALLSVTTVAGLPTAVSAAAVNNGAAYGISTNDIADWPQGPEINAETAIVMDADTGAILYNKGMDELRYPASITKVMTALLVMENGYNPEEQVTVTEDVLADQTSDSGNISLQVGEVLTMEQLLMATMIRSANDAATQLAVHVSGSVSAFADLMNQRAAELGCTNTHFVNASGMPDDNHYTTAHDMALIFREALNYEAFRNVILTQSYVIEPTNMTAEQRVLSIHNPLAAQSAPEYYEYDIGGKTGYTEAAQNTLVTGAEKDGMTLICVTLRSDLGLLCADQTSLFNYVFDNFQKVELDGGSVIIPNGVDVSTLTTEEIPNGDTTTTNYYYQGTYVGSATPVVETTEETDENVTDETVTDDTAEAAEETTGDEASAEETAEDADSEEDDMQKTYRTLIYILIGCIVVALVVTIVSGVKKSKKKGKKKNNTQKNSKTKNKNKEKK